MPAAAFQGLLNRDFTAKSEVYCEYSAAVGQNSSFQQHPMQPALSLRQHLFSNLWIEVSNIEFVTSNPDPKVRAQAAFFSGELGFSAAILNLIKALSDVDQWVVKPASEALIHFDEHDSGPDFIKAIERMPSTKKTELTFLLMDLPERISFSHSLRATAFPVLRKRLETKDEEVRFQLICALAKIGDPGFSCLDKSGGPM